MSTLKQKKLKKPKKAKLKVEDKPTTGVPEITDHKSVEKTQNKPEKTKFKDKMKKKFESFAEKVNDQKNELEDKIRGR